MLWIIEAHIFFYNFSFYSFSGIHVFFVYVFLNSFHVHFLCISFVHDYMAKGKIRWFTNFQAT